MYNKLLVLNGCKKVFHKERNLQNAEHCTSPGVILLPVVSQLELRKYAFHIWLLCLKNMFTCSMDFSQSSIPGKVSGEKDSVQDIVSILATGDVFQINCNLAVIFYLLAVHILHMCFSFGKTL